MVIMAIEASKFTEKDELIAKFYTLRAGLSAIAEETDKIKKVEQELSELNNKNEEYNKKVNDEYVLESQKYNNEISEFSSPYGKTASNVIKQRIANYRVELSKVEQHESKFSVTILPAILTFIGCMIISGILVNAPYPSALVAFYVGCIVPFIVGSLYGKMVTKREQESMRASIQSKIAKEEKELEAALKTEGQALIVLQNEFEEFKKATAAKMDIYKPEILKLETKLNTEVIPACTNTAKIIKKAMLETSDGIITERDWANLDLLVFYLETGRADSLKEALQLVDKQRQTDQITYAIHEASYYIASTVELNMNRLGTIVNNGFSRLAAQIQFNHNESMNTMMHSFGNLEDAINAGNREMSERLGNLNATIKAEGEKIANAEQLNASLLRKANENSDKLMYELRYNQKYWDK